MNKKTDKFLLIDGHGYLYRAFYATPGLTTSDGRPTNAVFGLFNMWRRLFEDLSPAAAAIVFDRGGSALRQELCVINSSREFLVGRFSDFERGRSGRGI